MAYIPGTDFNDSLYGTTESDFIEAFSGDDYLFGDYGDDTLYGGTGNDTLNGWNGQDWLDGGLGADNMDGDYDSDTYIVDNVGDIAAEFFDDGAVDTVISTVTFSLHHTIENLELSGVNNVNGTGNAKNNVLTGNSGKNVLDGKAGADTMQGGDGDDTYIVDNKLDKVYEFYNDTQGGVDLVKSSVSYTLGPASEGIENLTLTGSSAINGTGNGNKNIMIGNSANNVLTGLDGNDHLYGGGGKDTLKGGNGNDLLVGESGADTQTGGAGTDIFRYKSVSDSPAGTGRDIITDFKGNGSALGDQIDLKAIDANILKSGDQAFTWKGSTPGGAGTLWYSGGVVYGNIDGDAPAEFQIQLTGAPSVHSTDFML